MPIGLLLCPPPSSLFFRAVVCSNERSEGNTGLQLGVWGCCQPRLHVPPVVVKYLRTILGRIPEKGRAHKHYKSDGDAIRTTFSGWEVPDTHTTTEPTGSVLPEFALTRVCLCRALPRRRNPEGNKLTRWRCCCYKPEELSTVSAVVEGSNDLQLVLLSPLALGSTTSLSSLALVLEAFILFRDCRK